MASIPLYPYGYKLNFRGKKEVHEERAAVVRLIFDKYIGGMNRYAITWYLINHRILRPKGDSCDWQYSMVNRILQDERYIGTEKYPPILSNDIFEAAQEIRGREKEKAIAVRHESCNNDRKYPFSKFIKCGSCGSNCVRGIQGLKRVTKKPAWHCGNHRLKSEGQCKGSGNVYEEILEVICVEAYNHIRSECMSGKFSTDEKSNLARIDVDSFEVLIQETIEQMKTADEKRCIELQNDLNVLIDKKLAIEWERAPLDLSAAQTEKIKKHFEEHPMKMVNFEVRRFKEVFSGITALEPGKLKLILKNGNEIFRQYKPMKGQVDNAKKYSNYTCKADK